MPGSLLFVRGTGVRDIAGTLDRLRDGLARVPALHDVQVHGSTWGTAVGPKDLDITDVLPLDVGARGIGDQPSETEVTIAEWDLLTVDPTLELRMLAALLAAGVGSPGRVAVAAETPDVVLYDRLTGLSVPAGSLTEVGVTAAELAEAARRVASAPELTEAATAVGDPDVDELLTATARSVVATLLQSCAEHAGGDEPLLCRSGQARDTLCAAVLAVITPVASRAFGAKLVAKVFVPLAERLATRVAVSRRSQLTNPTTDFVRDIAFYLRRGEDVRRHIAGETAGLAEPVVLLGHSLGGIAVVDLMAASGRPEQVKLVVTVGSQAPYLYLMDALDVLRPGNGAAPATPWLNVYDRVDVLAFCASRVFAADRIVDEAVDNGVPFPPAHSAYFDNPDLYQLLAAHWPAP